MTLWPARYPDYAAVVETARPRSELWRLALGIVLIAVGYIAFVDFYLRALGGFVPLADLDKAETPAAALVVLCSFIGFTLPVLAVVGVLHARTLWSLIGAPRAWAGHFVIALLAAIALSLVLWVLPPWDSFGGPLARGLPTGTWLALLPLSLLAVFIQTSAEEVLFRGYLQQQLAARFASPWVWAVIPSALFGALHYAPESAGENAMLVVIWAAFFGVLMADLTARTGSLGPAMAIHFFNNVLAILVMSVPDNLSGLALYHLPFSLSDTKEAMGWLWVDFAVMIVTWLAVRLALRR